jgi:ATP-dependent protease Clp ATPase subunit
MVTANPTNNLPFEAAADFSSLRYRYVIADANGKAALPVAITNQVLGVIQNTPETGQEANVAPMGSGGSSKIVLGATLAAGAKVSMEAATGKAIAAASTATPAGTLLTGGDEDDLAEVLLVSQTPDA